MPLNVIVNGCSTELSETRLRKILQRNNIGIKVSGKIISFLRFADDITLLTNNEHDLEESLEEMTRFFQKYHLIIIWQKNKVIVCQKEERIRRINIQIGNKLLEQVEHYKYLGSV
jgi:hypothetical protein